MVFMTIALVLTENKSLAAASRAGSMVNADGRWNTGHQSGAYREINKTKYQHVKCVTHVPANIVRNITPRQGMRSILICAYKEQYTVPRSPAFDSWYAQVDHELVDSGSRVTVECLHVPNQVRHARARRMTTMILWAWKTRNELVADSRVAVVLSQDL